MPIDYNEYPDNWHDEIRPDILERAGHKCEFCGAANYEIIWRHNDNPERYVYIDDSQAMVADDGGLVGNYELMDYSDKPIKVVLTIAHLDHDITNNDYDNLRALCQRCHLVYDAKHHARKAAITRRNKYIEQTGQIELWENG